MAEMRGGELGGVEYLDILSRQTHTAATTYLTTHRYHALREDTEGFGGMTSAARCEIRNGSSQSSPIPPDLRPVRPCSDPDLVLFET